MLCAVGMEANQSFGVLRRNIGGKVGEGFGTRLFSVLLGNIRLMEMTDEIVLVKTSLRSK